MTSPTRLATAARIALVAAVAACAGSDGAALTTPPVTALTISGATSPAANGNMAGISVTTTVPAPGELGVEAAGTVAGLPERVFVFFPSAGGTPYGVTHEWGVHLFDSLASDDGIAQCFSSGPGPVCPAGSVSVSVASHLIQFKAAALSGTLNTNSYASVLSGTIVY